MSMHYYVERGYGLFLSECEAELMAKNFMNKNPTDYDDTDDVLHEQFDASIINDDNYDGRNIEYLATDEDEEFVDGVILYGSKSLGTIFANEANSRCYRNIDDMVDDFRNLYGEYLTEDFDYKSHLVEFNGAVFG